MGRGCGVQVIRNIHYRKVVQLGGEMMVEGLNCGIRFHMICFFVKTSRLSQNPKRLDFQSRKHHHEEFKHQKQEGGVLKRFRHSVHLLLLYQVK